MMQHHESQLQQACVKWFRLQYPKRIIFAIPNGGRTNIITGRRYKAEGVLVGAPDLMVPELENNYAGLFIEMKWGKGRLTEFQKEMHEKLKERGYKVEVCRTFDEFVKVVKEYFNG